MRDGRPRSRRRPAPASEARVSPPRAAAAALGERAASACAPRPQPATLLAAVQGVLARGARRADRRARRDPVRERDGVVTVACRAATWAQELDLLQDELLERLNEALGEPAGGSSACASVVGDGHDRLSHT